MRAVATTTFEMPAGSRAEEHLEERLPHERRHGEYRDVRIPLLVDVSGIRDAAWTMTANEAGAVVSFPRGVAEGARVIVHNVATGRSAVARVVASRPAESGANTSYFMALRLDTYPEYFWGSAYYQAGQPVH